MTRRSPTRHAIRKKAEVAFRNRMRDVIAPMRQPDFDETPLSPEEIVHGLEQGVFRVPFVSVSPTANHH